MIVQKVQNQLEANGWNLFRYPNELLLTFGFTIEIGNIM